MKRKWKYLLGVFLLAAGLFSGCAQESGQPSQGIQTAKESVSEIPKAAEEEILEAGNLENAQEPEQTEDPVADAELPEAEEKDVEALEIPETPEAAEAVETPEVPKTPDVLPETQILEEGTYTSREEVAEYIFLYGHLPDNFITKKEAKALGWVSSEGNLGDVAPGKSIGGDYFGNFEKNLPEKKGRDYHECDIDSSGGYRGAKRIVYSNDGLVYYTEDHYKTFELLYGEE